MKKKISVLLAFTLALSMLAGCGGSDDQQSQSGADNSSGASANASTNYQDGEYSVTYDVAAIDRTIDYLTVEVKDGKMTIKEYGCNEDTSGGGSVTGEVTDSGASGATEAEEKARQHMLEILDSYEDSGNNLDTMAIIPGAEEHTYRFIRMMRTAQEAAKSGTAKTTLGKYADGTYKAVAAAEDGNGWKDILKVVVTDGVISDVQFDAQKGTDASTLITADTQANSGTNKPSAYYPAIANGFIEAGEDLGKMFAPEGGELAIISFKKLMSPLVANMISGGAKEVTASSYVDGTYRAEFKDFDEYGWKDYIVITVNRGQVTVDEFDAYSKDDEKITRSRDEKLAANMKEATGTYTPREASKQLIANWEASNQDVFAVENVVGATVSSNNFKVLLANLLAANATFGDTETQIVERIPSAKQA